MNRSVVPREDIPVERVDGKPKGTRYSDSSKRQAVIEYAIDGTVRGTSRHIGVPRDTIRRWMKSDWWDGLVEENNKFIQDRMEAQLTQIIGLSHAKVIDSFQNGDEKVFYNAKLDKIVKTNIMPSGKDAMVTGAVGIDKLRLLRNQPTSIKSDSSNMKNLMDEFRQLSRSYETKVVNSIPGESKEVK